MELISVFFKKSVPNYFENLPIPNTFGGWFRLGISIWSQDFQGLLLPALISAFKSIYTYVKDWLSLVPLGAAIGGVTYVSYVAFFPKSKGDSIINPDIHKENAKHVDVLDVENLGEKTAVCRCWRSKKFPFCDGSHNKFNEAVGDNVGPLLVEKKK